MLRSTLGSRAAASIAVREKEANRGLILDELIAISGLSLGCLRFRPRKLGSLPLSAGLPAGTGDALPATASRSSSSGTCIQSSTLASISTELSTQ